MTVININNISGIASVNAQSDSLELFTNAGASLLDLNANLATFPGGISVGGTVTYDDVTNIDSVGVITARSGVVANGSGIGFQYEGTNNPFLGIRYNEGVDGSVLFLQHSRSNTVGTAASLSSGDEVGAIQFRSYRANNTNLDVNAQIRAIQTSDAGNNGITPTDLTFSTAASEKLRITGIGSVGIGTSTPATDVDISRKTGAVALPQGTTAQRPTGSAPYIRKNTTNNALEYYDGTSWVEIITDYFPTGSVILG